MTDHWCLRLQVIAMGQIAECELLKMIIDTSVFWVNKQLYFQFHYSYSGDIE